MRTREQIEKDARDGRNAFMLLIEVMLDVRQFYLDEMAKHEQWKKEREVTIAKVGIGGAGEKSTEQV